MRSLAVGLAVLVGFAGTLGCTLRETPAKPAIENVEEHHGIPPHKPATFTAAWEALSQRLSDPPHPETAAKAHAELLDIIRWLPELAAETDLPRAAWEDVQRLALALEQAVHSATPDWAVARTRLSELELLVRQTEDLSPHNSR